MVDNHNEYTHFRTKEFYFRFNMAAVAPISVVLVWPEVLKNGDTEANEILQKW